MNAIALLEFETVARGLLCADAMVKRAPLTLLRCGTVQPGRFLVLVGGDEAAVEEALDAGRERGGERLRDVIHLPNIHPDVLAAMRGSRRPTPPEALGIVETATVPAAIAAADAGRKGAEVGVIELRLADGLDGKGVVLFGGTLDEVEAAIELATAALHAGDLLVDSEIITRVAAELIEEFAAATRFRDRVAVEAADE